VLTPLKNLTIDTLYVDAETRRINYATIAGAVSSLPSTLRELRIWRLDMRLPELVIIATFPGLQKLGAKLTARDRASREFLRLATEHKQRGLCVEQLEDAPDLTPAWCNGGWLACL